MKYSENELRSLAQTNPKELSRILISSNATVSTLTFGAEILGGVPDEELVLPPLRVLLKHVHALVREGAMIGLSSFYIDRKPPQDILDKLKSMSVSDPSSIIKEYALTLLKDFESLS